jgi:hypothetical protein
VLLDTVGAIFSQWRVPALPQLPPSSAMLKTLWTRRVATPPAPHALSPSSRALTPPWRHRLPKYAGIEKSDPMFAVCEAGVAGDEPKAKDCLVQWATKREAIVAQLQARRTHAPRASATAPASARALTARRRAAGCKGDAELPLPDGGRRGLRRREELLRELLERGRLLRAQLAAELLGHELPEAAGGQEELRPGRPAHLPPLRGLRAVRRDRQLQALSLQLLI